MPLPQPELGMVVHYGFVWAGAERHPPPDAGKDRPCLIVDLVEVEDIPGRVTLRVTYLPISHVAARGDEKASVIGSRVASHLGLPSEKSCLYISYACEDDWPFDLAQIPGRKGRFHYGLIPPALFTDIANQFRTYLAQQPGFVHKR